MKGCAMYPLFNLANVLKTWQVRYCTGDYTTCERYKRAQRGLPVPQELMPNGAILKRSSSGKLPVVR
jgi:hypothetical protein